jgi:hypothetical protein
MMKGSDFKGMHFLPRKPQVSGSFLPVALKLSYPYSALKLDASLLRLLCFWLHIEIGGDGFD